jgi:hypothetical protein
MCRAPGRSEKSLPPVGVLLAYFVDLLAFGAIRQLRQVALKVIGRFISCDKCGINTLELYGSSNLFTSIRMNYPMKNMTRNVMACAISAVLTAGYAFAGDADFTLVNRTGYTLREVYVSPSHKNAWGKDRMGENVLENGKARLFKFSDKSSCKQDLKVVFDDDESEVVWEEFDLCELSKITLKYNRKTRDVSADTE